MLLFSFIVHCSPTDYIVTLKFIYKELHANFPDGLLITKKNLPFRAKKFYHFNYTSRLVCVFCPHLLEDYYKHFCPYFWQEIIPPGNTLVKPHCTLCSRVLQRIYSKWALPLKYTEWNRKKKFKTHLNIGNLVLLHVFTLLKESRDDFKCFQGV